MRTIRRNPWLVILFSTLLPAFVAGGCSGQYTTSAVSEQEKADIRSALEEYVTSASEAAREDSAAVPNWVAGVEEVELEETAKMEDGYKALARLQGKGPDQTRYFLLRRTEEGFQVTGVLSR